MGTVFNIEGTAEVRLRNNVINGVLIPDALVYRLERPLRSPKSTSATKNGPSRPAGPALRERRGSQVKSCWTELLASAERLEIQRPEIGTSCAAPSLKRAGDPIPGGRVNVRRRNVVTQTDLWRTEETAHAERFITHSISPDAAWKFSDNQIGAALCAGQPIGSLVFPDQRSGFTKGSGGMV